MSAKDSYEAKRLSVNALAADFVSVQRLTDGIAISIHGGEKDLGVVVSINLARELEYHLGRLKNAAQQGSCGSGTPTDAPADAAPRGPLLPSKRESIKATVHKGSWAGEGYRYVEVEVFNFNIGDEVDVMITPSATEGGPK